MKEQRETLVVVEYDGAVMWMPQAILRSNCPFSTTYFPFDAQMCRLKFGSWTYDGTQLDLEFFQDAQMMSLANYLSATEWDIVDNFANKTEFFYDCCPNQPYPDRSQQRKPCAAFGQKIKLNFVLKSPFVIIK